jgi:hypothetical protein
MTPCRRVRSPLCPSRRTAARCGDHRRQVVEPAGPGLDDRHGASAPSLICGRREAPSPPAKPLRAGAGDGTPATPAPAAGSPSGVGGGGGESESPAPLERGPHTPDPPARASGAGWKRALDGLRPGARKRAWSTFALPPLAAPLATLPGGGARTWAADSGPATGPHAFALSSPRQGAGDGSAESPGSWRGIRLGLFGETESGPVCPAMRAAGETGEAAEGGWTVEARRGGEERGRLSAMEAAALRTLVLLRRC